MPLKTHWEDQPSLNLTPMIDIVFLLVIFFMVGAKFAEREQKIPVSVPRVEHGGALTDAPRKRVISVDREGSVSLDGEAMDLAGLRTELEEAQREYRDLGVVVRGDREANFESVAAVVAACHDLEIFEIQMAVRQAKFR